MIFRKRDDDEIKELSNFQRLMILIAFIALCIFGSIKLCDKIDEWDAQYLDIEYTKESY